MNWTGGPLSRHTRKAKRSLVGIQKQHFAKLRKTQARGIPKPSPTRWSVFDRIELEKPKSRADHISEPEVKQPQAQVSKSRATDQHQPQRTEDRLFQQGWSFDQLTNDMGPKKSAVVTRVEVNNMTPAPSTASKRKRESSLAQLQSGCEDGYEEVSMKQKRRKLLGKGDWIGIGIQQPIKLNYTSSKDNERLGKRRRVSNDYRRSAKRQAPVVSPFAHQKRARTLELHAGDWAEQPRSDVRISIGSQKIPTGMYSRLKNSGDKLNPVRYSQNSGSDLMLLDADQVGNVLGGGGNGNCDPSHALATNLGDEEYHEYQETHRRQEHPRSRISISSISIADNPSSSIYQYQESKPGHSTLHLSANSPRVPISSGHQCEYQQQYSSTLGTHSGSPARLKGKNYGIGELSKPVYSSASSRHLFSPLLHHPAPRSAQRSNLLGSLSPSEIRSTIAEIGNLRPVVSPSQYYDNEVWKGWMDSAEEGNLKDEAACQHQCGDVDNSVSISPGVSAFIREPSPKDHISISSDDECDYDTSFDGGSLDKDIDEKVDRKIIIDKVRAGMDYHLADAIDTGKLPQEILERLSENSLSSANVSTNEIDYRNMFNISRWETPILPKVTSNALRSMHIKSAPSLKPREYQTETFLCKELPQQQPLESNRYEDPDTLWRKFVLSSESDHDDERGSIVATGCHLSEHEIPGSSQIAHPSSATQYVSSPVVLIPVHNDESTSQFVASESMLTSSGSSQRCLPRPTAPASTQDENLSTSDSITAQSQYHCMKSLPETSPPPLTRRVIFTKPKPFVGKTSNIKATISNKRPLYIGNHPRRRTEKFLRSRANRNTHNPSSSESEGAESISDD